MSTWPAKSSVRRIETCALRIRQHPRLTLPPEAEWRFCHRSKLRVPSTARRSLRHLAPGARGHSPPTWSTRLQTRDKTALSASRHLRNAICAAVNVQDRRNYRWVRRRAISNGRRLSVVLPWRLAMGCWKSLPLRKVHRPHKMIQSAGPSAQKITIPLDSTVMRTLCSVQVLSKGWPQHKTVRFKLSRTLSLSTLPKKWLVVGKQKLKTCFLPSTYMTYRKKVILTRIVNASSHLSTHRAATRPCSRKSTPSVTTST